jgi:hypothetical protein
LFVDAGIDASCTSYGRDGHGWRQHKRNNRNILRKQTGSRTLGNEEMTTSTERPVNHSLINANGNTHIKIAALAIAASLVFVAVVSASATTRTDATAHAYGPVVKATTLTNVAKTGASVVR